MDRSQMATLLWVDAAWIAFLAACCFLPSACGYYRRRRNAEALAQSLHANFLSIQSSLEEIERKRLQGGDGGEECGEEGGEGGDGEGGSREADLRRDWERLEQLFGPMPAENSEEDVSECRATAKLKHILMEVLKFLGFTGHFVQAGVEWRHRHKQEWGRKLVAALRSTSMAVQECDLVARDGNSEEDVELGGVAYDQNLDIVGNNTAIVDETGLSKPTSLDIVYSDGSPSANESDYDRSTKEKAKASHVASSEIGIVPQREDTIAAALGPKDSQHASAYGDSPSTNAPPQNTIPSDDATPTQTSENDHDDHDAGEGKYVALCLPCRNPADVSAAPGRSPRRLVPAACAICLGPYEPGCYVSWSSNKECSHAFHRDCVFMWLLRKEGPECPCCRGEFVSAVGPGRLNGGAGEEDAGGER